MSGRSSTGLDSWVGLATQMMALPFRMLGWGMQLITGTGQQIQRLGDRAGGSGAPAVPPQAAPPPPAWQAPAWTPPAPPPNSGTGNDYAAGAVPNPVETTQREEKDMACDTDLSGTDLKIIEYTIVSVDPDIQDDDLRILQPMRTVATTEDMNENGFIAWVIAMYFQQPEHRRLGEGENWKQYLRVCYCVQCRMPIPGDDCCQQQANALRDINRTLKRLGNLPAAGIGGGTGHYNVTGQGGGGSTNLTKPPKS